MRHAKAPRPRARRWANCSCQRWLDDVEASAWKEVGKDSEIDKAGVKLSNPKFAERARGRAAGQGSIGGLAGEERQTRESIGIYLRPDHGRAYQSPVATGGHRGRDCWLCVADLQTPLSVGSRARPCYCLY